MGAPALVVASMGTRARTVRRSSWTGTCMVCVEMPDSPAEADTTINMGATLPARRSTGGKDRTGAVSRHIPDLPLLGLGYGILQEVSLVYAPGTRCLDGGHAAGSPG